MTWTTSTLYVDAGGGTTIHMAATLSGIGPLFGDVLACSNADYVKCWEGPDSVNPAPAPLTNDYLPLKPSALLMFACADGTVATLRIPSPSVTIMLADRQTVDPTNALVATLITDAIGLLVSASGSPATAYLGGHLEATPRR